jgi:hypothetical protein
VATEAGSKVGDCPPVAALVDCVPAEVDAPTLAVNVSAPIEATPVEQARENTITQTGADPPPTGDQ